MIKRQRQKKTPGFTMIEMIVFMGVASIFIVMAFSLLTGFFKSRSRAKKLNLLQETTIYIFNQMSQEVHWSDEADTPPNTPLTELKLTQAQTELDELEIIFRVENDRLVKIVGDSPAEPISPPNISVNVFEVRNRAPADNIPCLEIQLGLEYSESNPKILSDNKTVFSLRKSKFKSLEE